MSLFDYQASVEIVQHSGQSGFYALLMAAMRRADLENGRRLRAAFPEVWAELQARYNAPGGRIESDDAPRAGDVP